MSMTVGLTGCLFVCTEIESVFAEVCLYMLFLILPLEAGLVLFLIMVVFVLRGNSHGSSVFLVQLTSTCRASCSYQVHPMGSPWYHTSTPWCPPRAPSSRFSDFFVGASAHDSQDRTERREKVFYYLLRSRSDPDCILPLCYVILVPLVR